MRRYVTLITSRKQAFTPANSVKLCDTPCWWKFHSRNQQDHQWKIHEFFMNTSWLYKTPESGNGTKMSDEK